MLKKNCRFLWGAARSLDESRWSREARGRAFAVLDSGDVVVLKETLVRGSEFLTAEHLLKGIEDTQDLKRGDISILDDWQQRSMEQFRAYSSPIDNGYITGKVDGAQGNVTFYPTGTLAYKIMCQVAKGSMTLETELGLYVFSTAGSIEVGDNMKDYVLTAVATSVNHELNKSLSPMRNWSDSSFQTAVRTQLDHVMGAAGDFSRQKTLTFELLCAKRTTYLGKVHSELAVSYEQGGAFLLGICDHQCFIPHYELPLSDFPQPIWRKVSAAGEVFEIMHDMTDVVLGQMTEGAFGDKWFPGQRMNFHPEGWVFLDHKHCDAKFGPTYGKIKHPDYYRIHQFQKYGEARVLAYPEAVDKYYPTVARLRRFRQNTPLALREFLENMKTVLLEEVNLKSETYKGLKAKAQERVKSYLDKPSPKELETICRMLVHATGLKNKIMRAASIFELNDEDAIRFGKSILMKCEPWRNDPAVMAQKEVDEHSPLIEKLLQMVVFR
ncbi:unnamed protein product [Effrenium voratum]|nr:unnamed protein product [Effrenium voratum]